MELRTAFLIAAAPLLAAGCQVVSVKANLEHCSYNEGDSYCAELDPSRPYCTQGDAPCNLGGFTGCVAEVTPDCHAPCGTLPEDECSAGESSGTDTGTASDSGSESGSESSTTGPVPCMGNEDCMDAEAPFCEPDSGECVRCDAMTDPDGACAELDPMTPLCVAGACVACTPENPVVCDDQLLLCDGDTNACVPCTEHEQCASGACELAMGRCFPEDFVVTVDGDGGADYTSIAAAVGDVDDGLHGVIVVHELNGAGTYQTPGGLIVGGGKTIALLAAPGEAPIIQGTGGNAGLRVEVAGTVVYVDGLEVSNSAAQGLVVDEALAWVDRSRIVGNDGGGIVAQSSAELTLRNCFVGGAAADVDAVGVTNSNIEMLYTTVGGGTVLGGRARALFCQGTSTANVRNGILVSADPMPEVECTGATLTNSATEAEVGNLNIGWFNGYAAGNFALSASGAMVFADVAVWQTGDPTTDIDGDARPTSDGAMDYAGADVPP